MTQPFAALFRSVTTSEKLADLPNDTTRLFFDWLLTVVDQWGRCTARPRQLNALVWPLLGKTVGDTQKATEALRVAGLIAVFPSEDGPFLEIVGHEAKGGSLGKKDHRRASSWPETAQLARLGPDWPDLAQAGPPRPSRAGARISSSLVSSQGDEGVGEGPKVLVLAEQPLPAALDRPDVRAALAAFQVCRRENGHSPYKIQGWTALLKKLTAWGPDRAIAALEHSSASTYQGVFEPKDGPPGSSGGRGKIESRAVPSRKETEKMLAEQRAIPVTAPPANLRDLFEKAKREAKKDPVPVESDTPF